MKIVWFCSVSIICLALISCANVSYHVSSIASLTTVPNFEAEKTYSYYDEDVSNEFDFGKFEIRVLPYNSIRTKGQFELFFIPVDDLGEYQGSVGKEPFQVHVRVKGEKNTTEFLPFNSELDGNFKVQKVKWKDPIPSCIYNFTDWRNLKPDTVHLVKDRLRNKKEKCMKAGWVDYLLEFNVKTPGPDKEFTLNLTFQDIESNSLINKKLFFSGVKFISTQTH